MVLILDIFTTLEITVQWVSSWYDARDQGVVVVAISTVLPCPGVHF